MVSPFFWGRLEGAGTFNSCSPLVSLRKGDAEGRGIGAREAKVIKFSINHFSDILLEFENE